MEIERQTQACCPGEVGLCPVPSTASDTWGEAGWGLSLEKRRLEVG